jgi:hypothetical protein
MAKGWRPGAKRLSWDGKVETARVPTEDEEWALFFALMDWRETDPDSMSPKLWGELRQYIEWHMTQRPWSRHQIKRFRWALVRNGRYRLGLGWDEAYKYASKWCKGTPAEGSPRTMREDYRKEQRTLPRLEPAPTNLGDKPPQAQVVTRDRFENLFPEFRAALGGLGPVARGRLKGTIADVARELREYYHLVQPPGREVLGPANR